MASATQEKKGAVTLVKISGNIDDGDDFDKMLGTLSGNLQINCRNVNRINSVGIKKWMKYFGTLQQRQVPFVFEEFSSALVDNLNMVQNFTCGAEVTSVLIPFACATCGHNFAGIMKSADIKAAQCVIPPTKCPKCQGQANFDDLAEEYFSFLNR